MRRIFSVLQDKDWCRNLGHSSTPRRHPATAAQLLLIQLSGLVEIRGRLVPTAKNLLWPEKDALKNKTKQKQASDRKHVVQRRLGQSGTNMSPCQELRQSEQQSTVKRDVGGSISLISLFTCFLHIVEDMLAAISSDSNIINSVPSNCGSVLVSTTNNYLKISSPIPHYDPRLHPTQKQTHCLSLCTCEDICFTAALENKYMIKIAIKQQLCRLCTRVIPTFGGVVYSPHESCSVD